MRRKALCVQLIIIFTIIYSEALDPAFEISPYLTSPPCATNWDADVTVQTLNLCHGNTPLLSNLILEVEQKRTASLYILLRSLSFSVAIIHNLHCKHSSAMKYFPNNGADKRQLFDVCESFAERRMSISHSYRLSFLPRSIFYENIKPLFLQKSSLNGDLIILTRLIGELIHHYLVSREKSQSI